jgi:hypothetical protein
MFESMPDPPSDSERLEAIRQHTHRSLRYYATAFLNSNGKERDQMRSHLDLAANYMALIEGESVDDRSMLARRSEIADRYVRDAKRDPWTPPCSFCGESPTVAWFEGPDFTHSVDASNKVRAEEAWAACATCLRLVQADDREGLARRGMRKFERHGRHVDPDTAILQSRLAQERFWAARSSG